MQATTPSSIHPLGILAVFVLIYALALGVLTFFVFWGSRLIQKIDKRRQGAGISRVTLRRAYLYGSVLALAPVMAVGMASIGRLDFHQLSLVNIILDCNPRSRVITVSGTSKKVLK
jgi:hypothetical protein